MDDRTPFTSSKVYVQGKETAKKCISSKKLRFVILRIIRGTCLTTCIVWLIIIIIQTL